MRSTILFCLLLTCSAFAADLSQIRYITEEYPPFNFRDGNQLDGMSLALLREIWRRTGTQRQPIELLPWARGYHELKLYPNTVLFAVARTQNREKQFKWACPIIKTRYVLFAQKSENIVITSPSELNLFTIGTIRADVGEQELLSLMEEPINILSNVTMRPNLDLMDKGRVHLIAYDELAAPKMFREFGRNPDDFETVYTIADSLTCFAFNLDTNDTVVETFQKQLTDITQEPLYQQLQTTYFSSDQKGL